MNTFIINPAVASREVDGQILFLLPDDYDIFTLNKTGKWVLQELLANHPRHDLAKGLAARYRLDETQAQRDVDALIQQLLEKRVLVSTDKT